MPALANRRKLAVRMLRVVIQHAVAMVPVIGPVLSVGVDLIDAVYAEIDESRALSREEIIGLLREIDQIQVDQTVDSVLTSQPGIRAVGNLTQVQLLRLRRQLADVPSALGHAIDQAVVRDRHHLSREEIARDRERSQLDAVIADQIRAENWDAARANAGRRLSMGRATPDVKRAERYLFRKQGLAAWYFVVFALATMGNVCILGQTFLHQVPVGDFFVFILGVYLLAALASFLSRYTNRALRIFLVLLPLLTALALTVVIGAIFPSATV